METYPIISHLYLYEEDGQSYTVQLIEDLTDDEWYVFRFLILQGDRFGDSFIAELRMDVDYSWQGKWKICEIRK